MLPRKTTMVVKMQYSDLAKRLKLSPQDTDVLLSLLADRQTRPHQREDDSVAELCGVSPLETGQHSEASSTRNSRRRWATRATTQYNQYEQTVEARTAVSQFAEAVQFRRNAASEHPEREFDPRSERGAEEVARQPV